MSDYSTLISLLINNRHILIRQEVQSVAVCCVILKICGRDMEKVGAMFDKVAAVSGENTHVTFTISAEVADLTENIKKYLK